MTVLFLTGPILRLACAWRKVGRRMEGRKERAKGKKKEKWGREEEGEQ